MQGVGHLDCRKEDPGLVATECRQANYADRKRVKRNIGEIGIELVSDRRGYIAGEAERDVKILRLDPAGARKRLAEVREGNPNVVRDLDTAEQPEH
jgi:hypothetical protein